MTAEAPEPSAHEALARERRLVFRRTPHVVGRASELPAPGSFFTHDALGIPLLITRDAWGAVHAMLNECRHRSTRLVYVPRGAAEQIVCSLHGWTYDTCGRFTTVRLSRCEADAHLAHDDGSLVRFAAEVRHGFVWVLPSARTALDLGAALGPVDGALTALDLEDHAAVERGEERVEASWRRVVEALLDEPNAVFAFPASFVLPREPGTALHVAVHPLAPAASSVVITALAARHVDSAPACDDARVSEALQRAAAARSDPSPSARVAAFRDALDRMLGSGRERT